MVQRCGIQLLLAVMVVLSYASPAANAQDTKAPSTSNLKASPNPVPAGVRISLTATVDDSAAGGSTIASAGYNIDGGSFLPMAPSDGTFDEVTEEVKADLDGFTDPGPYRICVAGTDAGGNVSARFNDSTCTLLGSVMVNPKDELEYVWIPQGVFLMGCRGSQCVNGESPEHRVNITKGFWMGRTEVTVGAYHGFVKSTGRSIPPGISPDHFNPVWSHEDHPIVRANWSDAMAYCGGAEGRLPTEAEWEYAARGGKAGSTYPWGEEMNHDLANYEGVAGRDAYEYTAPVGSFPANGYWLYDMAGNVSEWVSDRFDNNYYSDSPSTDPQGPSEGSLRTVRGGSWNSKAGPPQGRAADPPVVRELRASHRYGDPPAHRHSTFGFRCASQSLP